MKRFRLAIALALVVVSASARLAFAASADDVAAALVGSWHVRVAGSDRPRLLVLHKVTRANDDAAVLDGRYGWAETMNPARVVVALTRDGGGFVLEFRTPDSRVRARQSAVNQLDGTLETPKRTAAVVLERATAPPADGARFDASSPPAGVGEPLEQMIQRAGMAPWRGRVISLDVRLLRANGAEARLGEFINGTKPLVVYMYGVW